MPPVGAVGQRLERDQRALRRPRDHSPVSWQRRDHSRQNASVARERRAGVDRRRRRQVRGRIGQRRTDTSRPPPRRTRRPCRSPSPCSGAGVRRTTMSGPATARSVPSSMRVTHGTIDAVVEAQDELGPHRALRRARPTTRRTRSDAVVARRHEVDHGDGARRRSRTRSPGSACRPIAAGDARRSAPAGASSQRPCSGPPSRAAKQAAESKRGQHSQSIEPSRPTSAAVSQSPISA